MTHAEVFEGTWEELAAQAETFKGRKLRLIVLPEGTENAGAMPGEVRLRETARRLFAEADNVERNPGPAHHKPYKTDVGKIITEKYRKMGLKL
ncbi:hypothetical protein [Candidatus Entotheonella palauensis]|uniref:Uncharacterized protein n=1 Tax=Candidatus Entotheonella gemina TaxID=1429439 RepID=W4LC72_9BACT|nr:hypothetical protein [Candidatus Entotheonella palauensis]ETW95587.1 MAG: hypothetical protein ETSY2_47935 [Candidatus Entotheonella gemina]